MASDAPTICLVTIHGVGFEQSPSPENNYIGYADDLHRYLSAYLDETWLSDDPSRERTQRGEAGPIYVSSVWPPNSNKREEGLKRLGSWDSIQFRNIDSSQAPLSNGIGKISHVALVYSELEGRSAETGAAMDTVARSLLGLQHYATASETIRMALGDTQQWWEPLLHFWKKKPITTPAPTTPTPSLSVRPEFQKRSTTTTTNTTPQSQNDTGSVLTQLENDVAAYVCHNELRERIRNFVQDALLRLICRDDVEGIIINSHSNGTTIALDILRDLPPFAMKKVLGLITAGSPLRKYTDFFAWGDLTSTVPPIAHWVNFVDLKDPVGDPLAPDASWKRGQPKPDPLKGLYQALDPVSGTITPMCIDDREIDNLKYSSGGGLQAHNYWDNKTQFVQPLATILQGKWD